MASATEKSVQANEHLVELFHGERLQSVVVWIRVGALVVQVQAFAFRLMRNGAMGLQSVMPCV